MDKNKAAQVAYEQLIENHKILIELDESGHCEYGLGMILCQLIATLLVLDGELKDQFIEKIIKATEITPNETFEDREDFLHCLGQTLGSLDEN